jgi:hypothetical protein
MEAHGQYGDWSTMLHGYINVMATDQADRAATARSSGRACLWEWRTVHSVRGR